MLYDSSNESTVLFLSFQRLRIAANPNELWGPALQKYRNEAAETHKLHGTTMGGRALLPNAPKHAAAAAPQRMTKNGFNVPEKSVRYTPSGFNVPQDNPYPNNGRINPGFDSPMS